MSNEELTVLLLDKLGWDYDLVLNPKHYNNTPDILAGDFILSVFNYGKLKLVAEYFGVGEQTINRLVTKIFVPLFGRLNGGGESWKFKYLQFLQLYVCTSCNILKPYAEYHKDTSLSTGISVKCKKCKSIDNILNYKKDSVKDSHKKSYKNNKYKIIARRQKYKGERSLRIPKWSETALIEQFYRDCPEGFHVDHILPLKGACVSGLHVYNNLQYLPKKDNLEKGNRIDLDAYNSKHYGT